MPGMSRSFFRMTPVLACADVGFVGTASGQTAQNIGMTAATSERIAAQPRPAPPTISPAKLRTPLP
jgi:hypothetical protein